MQTNTTGVSPLFLARRVGVLLHPTSLPNQMSFSGGQPVAQMHGTLGKDAYAFVDFLADAGVSLWQMLPTGPTHADLSPYQSVSAHAGSPELISIDWLIANKWVEPKSSWDTAAASLESLQGIRQECAYQFYARLESGHHADLRHRLSQFCGDNHYWLDDFVLFMALR